MAAHTPLCVTFTLTGAGWVPPRVPMHLDGLLAWCAWQRALAAGRAPERFEDVIEQLPLARHEAPERPGAWVWQASMVQPVDVAGQYRGFMTRKTAETGMVLQASAGRLARAPATIDTKRGYHKNSAFYYTVQLARSLQAWCVGDPDEIADLLGDLRYVGKLRRLGMGALAGVADVSEDARAAERWRLRAMPLPAEGYVPVYTALRSPYWERARYEVAYVPLDAAA